MGVPTLLGILLAAVSASPQSGVAVDEVDLVEVNHFLDEQGQPVLHQVIFYDWCPDQCRFNVRDFRLLKSASQLPVRDHREGDYVATWHDNGVLRRVRATSFRESWTQHDPELAERTHLPKDQRRELTRRPQPTATARSR